MHRFALVLATLFRFKRGDIVLELRLKDRVKHLLLLVLVHHILAPASCDIIPQDSIDGFRALLNPSPSLLLLGTNYNWVV